MSYVGSLNVLGDFFLRKKVLFYLTGAAAKRMNLAKALRIPQAAKSLGFGWFGPKKADTGTCFYCTAN
jgi:hypothetical protein